MGKGEHDLSIVQWETAAFYVFEAEGKDGEPIPDGEPVPKYTELTVGVTRLGDYSGVARVQFKTFDMSALEGVNYVPVRPTWVEFQDGEIKKDVVIKVIPASSFDSVLEFGLYILPETVENAQVGKYLHTAAVKIIDMSAFPSNALAAWVAGGDRAIIMSIPPTTLVKEFLKVCYSIPAAKVGTNKMIISHQYVNVVSIAKIYILMALTKTLTEEDMSFMGLKNRGLLVALALLWVVPFAGVHYVNYARTQWHIESSLMSHLQVLLLKQFLNFTEDGRNQVSIENLVMTIVRDITAAVQEGYSVAIDLIFGSCVQLLLLFAAIIVIQSGSSGVSIPSVVSIVVYPMVIVAYLFARIEGCFELRQTYFKRENNVSLSVLDFWAIVEGRVCFET